jgi:hypothetical protein
MERVVGEPGLLLLARLYILPHVLPVARWHVLARIWDA